MKFTLMLLALVPYVMSAPTDNINKRGILDFLGLNHALNLDELKSILANITNQVGSDATEQQCETTCHNIMALEESHLLHTVCTPICRSFQTLIHLIPIPRTRDVSIDKRGILDFLGLSHALNLDELKSILANITNQVGSDATEQQCETTCHNIMLLEESHLLHTVCTPICRSFQTLIHLIPIHRTRDASIDKRSILDFLGLGHILDLGQLRNILAGIADEVGSDATEQNCETACHNILALDLSHVLHTVCTPICRSFQTLIQLIPIHHTRDVSIDKRGILDFLGLSHALNLDELKSILYNITHQVGSDATEQQCETTCHNIMALEESHLLHTVCTPICRSFQTLIQLIPIHHTRAVSINKRGILDFLGFGHVLDIGFIRNKVQLILDDLGSDASEQQCEQTCHNTLALDESSLIHTVCTPICRSFQTLVNLFGLRPHHQTTAGN